MRHKKKIHKLHTRHALDTDITHIVHIIHLMLCMGIAEKIVLRWSGFMEQVSFAEKGLIRTYWIYWKGKLKWPDISTYCHLWIWIKGMDQIIFLRDVLFTRNSHDYLTGGKIGANHWKFWPPKFVAAPLPVEWLGNSRVLQDGWASWWWKQGHWMCTSPSTNSDVLGWLRSPLIRDEQPCHSC